MQNRILIVDDQISFRDGLSKALKRNCDYFGELKAIDSGEKAIDEAGSHFYDICFLDINLPGISGLDVMEKIRDISPGTEIVIMTASCLDDDMKKRIENGAALLVPKPVDLNIIRDFIDRKLKKAKKNHNNGFGRMKNKREFSRMPCKKTVNCSISVFYNWELKSGLEVDIIDISDGGAGVRLSYPLYPGNVLRFSDLMDNKSGIVKWIMAKTDDNYRVGIKFI